MVWPVRAVAVVAVVAAGILVLLYVVRAPTVGDDSLVGRSNIAALWVGVAALLLSGLVLLPGLRRWVRDPRPVPPQATQQAAQHVADAALTRWEKEARLRGITGPGQLPVAWRWADSHVAIPAGNMNPRFTGPTTGLVTDLVQLYRALDPNWNRLVILGGPGSGKTGAMTLLLLNVLRGRRPDEPVPVWITLGGWNPEEQTLRDYVAAVIGRDFPSTHAQAAGGTLARHPEPPELGAVRGRTRSGKALLGDDVHSYHRPGPLGLGQRPVLPALDVREGHRR